MGLASGQPDGAGIVHKDIDAAELRDGLRDRGLTCASSRMSHSTPAPCHRRANILSRPMSIVLDLRCGSVVLGRDDDVRPIPRRPKPDREPRIPRLAPVMNSVLPLSDVI